MGAWKLHRVEPFLLDAIKHGSVSALVSSTLPGRGALAALERVLSSAGPQGNHPRSVLNDPAQEEPTILGIPPPVSNERGLDSAALEVLDGGLAFSGESFHGRVADRVDEQRPQRELGTVGETCDQDEVFDAEQDFVEECVQVGSSSIRLELVPVLAELGELSHLGKLAILPLSASVCATGQIRFIETEFHFGEALDARVVDGNGQRGGLGQIPCPLVGDVF